MNVATVSARLWRLQTVADDVRGAAHVNSSGTSYDNNDNVQPTVSPNAIDGHSDGSNNCSCTTLITLPCDRRNAYQ